MFKKSNIKYNFTLFQFILIIIVLGITIELIVGSINLTRNGKIKKTILELNKYTTAINTFKRKYGELPGDIRKTKVLRLSKVNTDGNENGLLEDRQGSIKQASGEITNFWLHLTNSRFLEEKFNGMENEKAMVKKTFPVIGNVGITVFGYNEENYLQIGVIGANNSNIEMTNRALDPNSAFILDKKLDDGLPKTGDILATGGNKFVNGINFVSKNCATDREYLVKSMKPACQLRIKIDVEK